jgi:hypothetical protein
VIASRTPSHATRAASNTACPPRRSFVASDDHRRGQACRSDVRATIAFGAALSTSAMLADVDNARRFSVIVDD